MADKASNEPRSHRNLAKRTHEMLMSLALTDQLTGLLNRRGVESEFNAVKGNLERSKDWNEYSIIAFDLIGLKRINDELGHDGADEVLVNAADSLKMLTRGSDLACRWSGDEFLLVTFNTNANGATRVIEEVNNNLPKNVKYCIGYKTFEPYSDFSKNLVEVTKQIEDVKKQRPHDENGRVTGDGVVVQLL
jgi:diguanylate cyclase (GGDEF)-like protein